MKLTDSAAVSYNFPILKTAARFLVGVCLGVLMSYEPAFADSIRRVEQGGVILFTNAPVDGGSRLESEGGSETSGTDLPGVAASVPNRYAVEIQEAARRHGVEAKLVEAVIAIESAFNPRAVSRKGAGGLMQLMPQTAAGLGVRNVFDPRQNIDGGVRYLRHLLDRYRGDLRLSLAAYNAGPQVVEGYRGIPPYPETKQYVQRVLELYQGGAAVQNGGGEGDSGTGSTREIIYRYEDEQGRVTYTNTPPMIRPALF